MSSGMHRSSCSKQIGACGILLQHGSRHAAYTALTMQLTSMFLAGGVLSSGGALLKEASRVSLRECRRCRKTRSCLSTGVPSSCCSLSATATMSFLHKMLTIRLQPKTKSNIHTTDEQVQGQLCFWHPYSVLPCTAVRRVCKPRHSKACWCT